MTLYGNLFSFYILILFLIPSIILGLWGKKSKTYGFFITLIIILLLANFEFLKFQIFLLFYFYEILLIRGYLSLRKENDKRWVMRLVVFLSILPLIITKAFSLLHLNLYNFFGISYITFRCVQMIIEIYDGLIKEVPFLDTSYFLLFFPTISSGPIDRSRRFLKEINTHPITGREYFWNYLSQGILKIFKGVGYKFIIANIILAYWLGPIPAGRKEIFNILNYMYAYSLFLFFDFAGYSSIAIGTSYILGVKTPENFNMPFISKDMKDFWNRWHMSLSYWFRDFIYTRFVMSSLEKRRFKNKHTASYLGFLITMVTMGLWHGTKLHYLIYGFYEGILLVLTEYIQVKSKFYKNYRNHPLFNLASILINFHFACFGLFLFSGYFTFKKLKHFLISLLQMPF